MEKMQYIPNSMHSVSLGIGEKKSPSMCAWSKVLKMGYESKLLPRSYPFIWQIKQLDGTASERSAR